MVMPTVVANHDYRFKRSFMNYKWRFILLLCFLGIPHNGYAKAEKKYLPVVLVAGLNSDNNDMKPLQELINKYLPDVYVKNVQIGLGKYTTFWNIYSQTNEFVEAMYSDCNLRHGFNMIAWSQGGLVGRYYIERHNMPPVCNYIALASPQRGYFGTPSSLDKRYKWLDKLEPHVSNILYLAILQRYLSIAGYWHDPLKRADYLNYCQFLPYLNNEKAHCHTDLFKENLTRLANVVLIQATCDSVIEPVESTHFGFYKEGTDDTIETLFESKEFQEDSLGLKTLFDAGKLHLRTTNGTHYETVSNEKNFLENILPFLMSPTIDDFATVNRP